MLGAITAGCIYREPNWRNVESSITRQPVESDDYVYQVSPLLQYEELRDHIESWRAAGWEVDRVTPGGRGLDGMYLVTYRR